MSWVDTIAIDPGLTIGVAILDPDGGIVDSFTIDANDSKRCRLVLRALCADGVCDRASFVVEKGPQFGRHNDALLTNIEDILTASIPGAFLTWLAPGNWKHHPAARLTADEREGRTVHERDAIGMGRVHQTRNKGA